MHNFQPALQDSRLSNLLLKQMSVEDIPELVRIDRLSNPEPWSWAMFEQELKLPFSISSVAIVKGGPAAFLIAWHIVDTIQILELAVLPEMRRLGIGQMLVEQIKNSALSRKAKKIELELREDNSAALALYQKCGFSQAGLRIKFYGDMNAILMNLDLDKK